MPCEAPPTTHWVFTLSTAEEWVYLALFLAFPLAGTVPDGARFLWGGLAAALFAALAARIADQAWGNLRSGALYLAIRTSDHAAPTWWVLPVATGETVLALVAAVCFWPAALLWHYKLRCRVADLGPDFTSPYHGRTYAFCLFLLMGGMGATWAGVQQSTLLEWACTLLMQGFLALGAVFLLVGPQNDMPVAHLQFGLFLLLFFTGEGLPPTLAEMATVLGVLYLFFRFVVLICSWTWFLLEIVGKELAKYLFLAAFAVCWAPFIMEDAATPYLLNPDDPCRQVLHLVQLAPLPILMGFGELHPFLVRSPVRGKVVADLLRLGKGLRNRSRKAGITRIDWKAVPATIHDLGGGAVEVTFAGEVSASSEPDRPTEPRTGFDRQRVSPRFFAGHLTLAPFTFTLQRDGGGRFRITGVPDRIDWTFEAEKTPLVK